ncbi:PDDEXK nuclease domain-containing protein [Roseivirga echinicomitans]|uniref:50S ribosomal protein L31 n=1 Tax=Roseivirga echinicomitans TaxID=296218 RepID=A0A150XXP0_9BACT|nr:PDDEXK nuclease domain-containing protein [Roseivirga echinicomitans]KYG83468.1 hypothetical protein AWN68_01300 [Roseivirga echinicomitans]
MNKELHRDKSYEDLLQNILLEIESHRKKASEELTITMMQLYDTIGKRIVEKQEEEGWGKSIVEQLAMDINKVTGSKESFSSRNLWYMRQYHLTYLENEEQRLLSYRVNWGQNILLFTKIKDGEERKYYLECTIEAAWSRNTLFNAIKSEAYKNHRLNKKQSNFKATLPAHFSEQANETLKSEYTLSFLDIDGPILERQLENKIVARIKDFVLELGYGFTYMGNQYKLVLRDKDYFVDLLFFHRKLKCIVAIDLKIGEFQPEFAGKMNFYLNLLNEQVRLPEENPSIGIILCAEKDNVEVDYALIGVQNPIGVAEYTLKKKLPQKYKGELPGVKELKTRLTKEFKANHNNEKS